MVRKDFIPDSYKNLHDWSANYSNGVSAVATRIGWPTASVTTLKGQLDSLTKHALDTAVGQLAALKGNALAQIRAETKSLKATHGFTEGDAKALGVYTTPETFNPNIYQPTLEATARHSYVDLMAKKQGADSLNVYVRPAGTANWTLLSAKRFRSPSMTTRPPLPEKPCNPANTWRWVSLATRKSATRATLPARCFRREACRSSPALLQPQIRSHL